MHCNPFCGTIRSHLKKKVNKKQVIACFFQFDGIYVNRYVNFPFPLAK